MIRQFHEFFNAIFSGFFLKFAQTVQRRTSVRWDVGVGVGAPSDYVALTTTHERKETI